MAKFAVKFFGARKERGEQVKQVKLEVDANLKSDVEFVLRHQYGYKVINGLKIREISEQEAD